jgi:DNA-binding NtrC family response regulator
MCTCDAVPLTGCKILIVEDEAAIALNLATAVQRAGGIVIGPVASVAEAHVEMADNRLDGALLDIRLRNETSFPLADILAVLNIPFVFVSGLSSALMPYTHRERPLFDKPYEATEVIEALARLIRPAPAAPQANDAPA